MKNSIKILILILISLNLNAQLIECRSKEDNRIGIQLAKNKFESLRSSNGTVYKKAAYNNKYDYTVFVAITELGNESMTLYNKSENFEGIEFFAGHMDVEFTNGIKKEFTLYCYDLNQMNKKRKKEGAKLSPITVKDY